MGFSRSTSLIYPVLGLAYSRVNNIPARKFCQKDAYLENRSLMNYFFSNFFNADSI